LYLVSDYIRAAGKGTCYVCRAHRRSHQELILDFDREIEWEGALQVCAPCIKEAAGLTGALAEATAAADAEVARLRAENETLAQALDAAEIALQKVDLFKAARSRRPKAADDE